MLYIGSAGFLPSIVVHSTGLINPFHSQLFILGFVGNLHQKTATTNTSDNEEDRHSERHQTPYVFAHGRHRGLSASPMVYGNLDPKVVWLLHYKYYMLKDSKVKGAKTAAKVCQFSILYMNSDLFSSCHLGQFFESFLDVSVVPSSNRDCLTKYSYSNHIKKRNWRILQSYTEKTCKLIILVFFNSGTPVIP